jgi:hypothetical protein
MRAFTLRNRFFSGLKQISNGLLDSRAIFPALKRTQHLGKPRPARLKMELLESRTLPTVAPTFALATQSASEIDVSWSDVSGLPDKYYVVNELNNATGTWQTVDTVASGAGSYTYKATGLSADSTYEFEVGGMNPPFVLGGRLYPGPETFAAPQTAITFVTAPTFTVAPIGYSALQVQWQEVSTWNQKLVAQYTINVWADGVEQKPISIDNTSYYESYTLSNLNDADTYQVQVGADCPDQNATSWALPQTTPALAAPGFSLSSPTPTDITVSWGNVPQATDYVVEVFNSQGYLANIQIFDSAPFNNYATTFSGMLPGTQYSVGVMSYGPWGNASEALQPITTQSDLPVLSAAPISTTGFNLSWTPISGATFDVAEVTGTSSNPTYTILKTGVSGTSTQCTRLATNSEYSFAVRADGPWGDSSWSTATPLTYVYPTAPTSFTAVSQNSTTVQFNWSSVPNAIEYMIDVYSNGSFYFGQPVTGGSSTSLNLNTSSFTPGQAYSFLITAENPTGWSAYGPGATATLWPNYPSFTLTNQSPDSVWVSWTPVPGITNYDIKYWISGQTPVTTPAMGTSDQIIGLKSNQLYYFDVAADNTASGGGATYNPTSQTITTIGVVTSSFQSGYVGTTSSSAPFTEAFGTWVVPTVTNTAPGGSTSAVSIWVGIDDNTGGVKGLPQIGMSWDSTNGYWPWVEIADSATPSSPYNAATDLNTVTNQIPNQGSFNIQAGDTISAGLVYNSGTASASTYTFYFEDISKNGVTTKWSDQITTSTGNAPARGNALWMVESPTVPLVSKPSSSAVAPLANFGAVTFLNAWASNGTTTGPITDFGLQQWVLGSSGSNNGGTTTVGGITNLPQAGWNEPGGDSSSAFSVDYVSTLNAGPSVYLGQVAGVNAQNSQSSTPSNQNSDASQSTRVLFLDPSDSPALKLVGGTRGKRAATAEPRLQTADHPDDLRGLFDGTLAGPYVDADRPVL